MNNIKKILEISPETLRTNQLLSLKNHAKKILSKIQSCIDTDDYDTIQLMLKDSPAGDGYGLDNCFIDFCFSDSKYGDDIGSLISKLSSLKGK